MLMPVAVKRRGEWWVEYRTENGSEFGHYGPFPNEREAAASADRFTAGFIRRQTEREEAANEKSS